MNVKILVEFEIGTTCDDEKAAERNAAAILADELQKAGIIGSREKPGLFSVQLVRIETLPFGHE